MRPVQGRAGRAMAARPPVEACPRRGGDGGLVPMNSQAVPSFVAGPAADALFDHWNPELGPGSFATAGDSLEEGLVWAAPAPEGTCDEEGHPGATAAPEPDDSFEPGATASHRSYPGRDRTTRVASGDGARVDFPRLGQAIGGFRLISELGRGAFARVYLAHETALGNRPVALKVSRAEGDEPRVLARLQHTHIVPIHSVSDDPATGLRLICMPYLGGANLSQVLDAAAARPGSPRARSLLDALDLVARPSPPCLPPKSGSGARPGSRARPTIAASGGSLLASLRRSLFGPGAPRPSTSPRAAEDGPQVEDERGQPARRFLRGADDIRGSAWIVARLAEGLDHAHSRGLLHRDLKPSNILIAADGVPMLLDFNLAAESLDAADDDGARAMMGGTLPYMAPEHLDAFNPDGVTPAGSVDERADLYALGLILFEMIAGRSAFPDPPEGLELVDLLHRMTAERRAGAPSLRAADSRVPRSLDSIVSMCLDPDPGRRYPSAGALAEDLRRFLDDLPLKFAPEPSLGERLAKWARRHPRASSAWTIAPLALVLTAAVGGIAWAEAAHLREVAARLNLRRFRESFHECQFLLNTAGAGGLGDHLRPGVERAHALIDRFDVGRGGNWSAGYWVAPLAPEEQASLRRDLSELILLEARARVRLAEAEGTEDDRRRALEWSVAWLDRAEALDPTPSPALFAERARAYHALGEPDPARRDRERAAATPAATCRDEYLLGTADLADGHPDRAEARLRRAVALDPRRFWAWFALGLCHFDQGRFADAAGDFTACTLLTPEFAWPFANRGLALARSGRLSEAIESLDRALDLSPSFAQAAATRGLVLLEAGDPAGAERDLARALKLGRDDVSVRAGRAEALARLGRRDEALTIYDDLIASRPFDARLLAARGMARLASNPPSAEADFRAAVAQDPKAATAHYGLARVHYPSDLEVANDAIERALAADPSHLDALQLRALIRARLGREEAVGDVDRLLQSPTPHRLYNAACALAILARSHPAYEARAVDLLRRAIESGFPAGGVRDDPDFASLRSNASFRALVEGAPVGIGTR